MFTKKYNWKEKLREIDLTPLWDAIGTIYMWSWMILIPLTILICICVFLYYLITGKLF